MSKKLLTIILLAHLSLTIQSGSPNDVAVRRKGIKKNIRMFQVSLLNRYNKHYCGGAIIRSNWILTAGRCSLVCGEDLMCAVRYGSLDINTGRYAPIRIFAVNPDSNIALAEAPLIIQGNVKPILIYTYSIPAKALLMAVGWRWERSPRTCYKLIRRIPFHQIDCTMANTICAIADKTLCYGDYGGALVYQNKLIGISNFGLVRENVTISEKEEEEEEEEEEEDNAMNNTYVDEFILRPSKLKTSGIAPNNNITASQRSGKVVAKEESVREDGRANVGSYQRCYPGYGTFLRVSSFTDWIDLTIREYTEEYDLNNLPFPDEWTREYIKANYDFDKSPNQC